MRHWEAEKVKHLVKCAGCGELQVGYQLEAERKTLEDRMIFVLCEPCYIHIRKGYQRDRDLRAMKREHRLALERLNPELQT